MKRRDAERLRDKHLADHLFRRIFALLEAGEWTVRYARIRGNARLLEFLGYKTDIIGCTDWDNHVIWIDHRDDILATAIHECLHVLFPGDDDSEKGAKASELFVREKERFLVDHLGPRRAMRLHALINLLLC